MLSISYKIRKGRTRTVVRLSSVPGKTLDGASLRGRPTPPATLAREEKVHRIIREVDSRSMIEHIYFMIVVPRSYKLATR